MPQAAACFRGPEGVRGALWRSLAVFRLVAVVYAAGTVGRDVGRAPHPVAGIGWFGVLIVWSLVMSLGVPAADRRQPWLRNGLVTADVAVCVAVMLSSGAVSPSGSVDVLPALWTASGVFSAALVGGTAGGAAGGVALAVASFVVSGAAVVAVLANVAAHAGSGAAAWLLVEDAGDSVIVTVRDDGVGIEPGRIEQAAAEGRLGLAVSVRGRIRELGGDVVITGRPGEGTEVELRVPR